MRKKATRRSSQRRRLTLSARVLIVEKHLDGLISQCILELDARLKQIERQIAAAAVTQKAKKRSQKVPA